MRWGHGCEPLHRGFAVGGRGLRAPWAGRAPDVAPKVQAAVPVAGPVEVAPLHAEPVRAARSGARCEQGSGWPGRDGTIARWRSTLPRLPLQGCRQQRRRSAAEERAPASDTGADQEVVEFR